MKDGGVWTAGALFAREESRCGQMESAPTGCAIDQLWELSAWRGGSPGISW